MLKYEISALAENDRRWEILFYAHVALFFVLFSMWALTARNIESSFIALGPFLYGAVNALRAILLYRNHCRLRRFVANGRTLAINTRKRPARFIKRRDCVGCDIQRIVLALKDDEEVSLWETRHFDADTFRGTFMQPLADYWGLATPRKLAIGESTFEPISYRRHLLTQRVGLILMGVFTPFLIFIVNFIRPVPIWAPITLVLLVPLFLEYHWHRVARRIVREQSIC